MLPGVEFILDIGGQDMKCLRVRDGVIDHIMLNEACSSGCGSFIESFASGLNLDVTEFAKTANAAKHPVDLGSRCTVFMNSRVKQAQKEGATVGDIAAGLAISVIKNALFKVIKIRDPREVGDKVIVQGGTFLNDAVLRAFEQLSGANAVRPDIAGNMGAYGAALLARDRAKGERPVSTLLSLERIEALEPTHKTVRCKACSNHCLLTVNDFGVDGKHRQAPPLHHGQPLRERRGRAGRIVQRAEPVRLQEPSPVRLRAAFRRRCAARHGGHSARAEHVRELPVLVHLLHEAGLSRGAFRCVVQKDLRSGHREHAVRKRVLSGQAFARTRDEPAGKRRRFHLDAVRQWERQEDAGAGNHFNCPIVASYSEALRLNIDELRTSDAKFLNPWLPYDQKDKLKERLFVELYENFSDATCRRAAAPTRAEVSNAVEAAWAEDMAFKDDIRAKGEETMGEGWLLTAEMVELIRTGAPNVVCTQPFACLPNHVVGKAVIKELRRRYPESNIVAVDYDSGASEVNQLNRIKLMISVAKANLEGKEAEARRMRDVARAADKVAADAAAGCACGCGSTEEVGAFEVQESRAER